MTRAEKVVSEIKGDLAGKHLLEVACGCAEFSIAAAGFAKDVCCIDLDESRLPKEIGGHPNITFRKMDATALRFDHEQFDTVVFYNAIGHLVDIIPAVIAECMRVVKKDGRIYVISSFAMDKAVMRDILLPHLRAAGIVPLVKEGKIDTRIVFGIRSE